MPTDRGGGEEPREGGARPIKPRRPGAERVRGGASSRRMGHPEAARTEAQEPRWAALQGRRGHRRPGTGALDSERSWRGGPGVHSNNLEGLGEGREDETVSSGGT